jgi:hypothetical protein
MQEENKPLPTKVDPSPESQLPTPLTGDNINPHAKRHWKKLIPVAFVIFLILCGAAYSFQHYVLTKSTSTNPKTSSDNFISNSSKTVSPAEKARIAQGLPPNQSSGPVAIKYITIKNNQPYDNNSDSLSTSNGNYILHQATNVLGGASLGEIIYDGKVVYQDPDSSSPASDPAPIQIVGSVALSDNGLHYGYVLEVNNNLEIYIDNKLVKTYPVGNLSPLSDSDVLDAISNDGTSYEYTEANANSNNTYVVSSNGTTITASTNNICATAGICPIYFDSDLANYITYDGSNYTYDGKIIKSNINQSSTELGISQTGAHYYVSGTNQQYWYTITSSKTNPNYTCKAGDSWPQNSNICSPPDETTTDSDPYLVSGTDNFRDNLIINVDGNTVYSSKVTTIAKKFNNVGTTTTKSTSPSDNATNNLTNGNDSPNYSVLNAVGVNDNGDYYFVENSSNPYFVIDGEDYYSLKNTVLSSSASSETAYCAVNDNETHYVITGSPNNSSATDADIDGTITKLSGNNIDSTELDGNTLYVYSFAQ